MHTRFRRYRTKCYFCKNIQFPLCPLYSLVFSPSRNRCVRSFFDLNHFNPPPFGLLWSSVSDWINACVDFLSVVGVPACPPSVSLSLLSSEILYPSPPDLPARLASGHLLYFCSLPSSNRPCSIQPRRLVTDGLPLPVPVGAFGTPTSLAQGVYTLELAIP